MLEFYPLCNEELLNIFKLENHAMKLVLEKLFWVVEDGMVNGTENNVM